MSKEAFIAKYIDQTVGLLIGAFAQNAKTQHQLADSAWAADGKFMIAQMQRAKALLGQIWDDMQPKEKK